MLITINGFLESIIGVLISCLYIPMYNRTRDENFSIPKNKKKFFGIIFLCVCINLLVNSIRISGEQDLSDKLFNFILMLTADVDLMIMKIPTGFLILLLTAALKYIIPGGFSFSLLATLFLWIIWLSVRNKLRIGIYDTLLLLIFSLCFKTVRDTLLFNSLFMILYGIAGLILKYIFRKSPETKIPLSPLIITAFKFIQLFS